MDNDQIGLLRTILKLAADNANKDVIFSIAGHIWINNLVIPDHLGETNDRLDL